MVGASDVDSSSAYSTSSSSSSEDEGDRRKGKNYDNPPRKIPYYHPNQSTLVIKQ
jgi:hypothetical protein